MKLNYVASALGFAKLFHWSETDPVEQECAPYIANCLRVMQGRNNNQLSLLYNAYTEQDIGRKLRQHFGDAAHTIFGDSGGLQVVSRGLPVTDAIKDGVYENQAANADVAMIFDAIPVKVLYTVSNPNFIGNREFDPDLVEPKARETARNIKRQIDIFDKLGSKSKPNVIMQGNCNDSFQRWAEFIVDELGDDYLAKCHGMSLADTAHGVGLLDDVERFFFASKMQVPDNLMNQIHLLGVGRIRRLLPIVIMAENGFFPKTETISYDSSTHTRQLTIGYHFINNVMFNFSKDRSYYSMVEADIVNKTKNLFGYDIDTHILRDILVDGARSTDRITSERKSSEYIRDMIKCCASALFVSIDNFCGTVINATQDDNVLMQSVLDSKNEFYTLKQVKTADDFHYWFNHCSKRLKSQKVKCKDVQEFDLFA